MTSEDPPAERATVDAPAPRGRVLQRSGAGMAPRGQRPVIPRRETGAVAPASFGQEQIWLHSQLAPDVPLYTESLTIRRRGPLDANALVASLRAVVRRHEIWRTTLAWSRGALMQEVHPDDAPRVRVVDLRPLPLAEREPAALRLAAEELRAPFDIAREPGVRAQLVTLSDVDHRLYLCLHHLVFDGLSIYRVLLRELTTLYDAAVRGTPGVLEEPPLQYADFAAWQRRTADDGALQPLVRYWRGHLAGASPTIALPADRPRPDRQSFRGGLVRSELAADLTAAVRRAALDEQCTVFMVLLASFAATLYRWSGQSDMTIGTVSGGRDRPELDRLIGYFLRVLVLRLDLSGDPSFRTLLRRVREELVDALCHEALPFQRLVQAVAPERTLDHSPLFQVTFSIEPPMPAVGATWTLTEMDAGTEVSKFDLSIELEDRGPVVAVRAIYSRDLFAASTIAELLSDWDALLRGALADVEQPLSALVA